MKIGIIGAGQIGGTLARRFSALGHKVMVANSRGPETLKELAAETGAMAVPVRDAVRDADLVVVTIPEKNIPSLPKGLFAESDTGLVVVDTGNYYPRQRDGRIAAIEAGLPESRWVEQQLGRPVIKAFNNIVARHLLERGTARRHTGAHRPPHRRRRRQGQGGRAATRRRAGVRRRRCRRARRILAPAARQPGLRQGFRCRRRAPRAVPGEAGAHGRVARHGAEPWRFQDARLTRRSA